MKPCIARVMCQSKLNFVVLQLVLIKSDVKFNFPSTKSLVGLSAPNFTHFKVNEPE